MLSDLFGSYWRMAVLSGRDLTLSRWPQVDWLAVWVNRWTDSLGRAHRMRGLFQSGGRLDEHLKN
jgi:hypothetical protein